LDQREKPFINKDTSGSRFANNENIYKDNATIKQIYGDSAAFDFTPYKNKMDFIFVDGSHQYDYVVNDTKVALSLLRDSKGIILWHDYDAWFGVTLALNEFQQNNPEFRLTSIKNTSLVLFHKI
jgi:hypothetical protein